MDKNEKKIANIIYDTLMDNAQFQQFPADDISDQQIDTGNHLEHPEITFSEQGIEYKITIERILKC